MWEGERGGKVWGGESQGNLHLYGVQKRYGQWHTSPKLCFLVFNKSILARELGMAAKFKDCN